MFLCGYLVPESCNLKDDSSVRVATLDGSVEMAAKCLRFILDGVFSANLEPQEAGLCGSSQDGLVKIVERDRDVM